MLAESDAIRRASQALKDTIAEAVRAVLGSKGKVITTGLGKSGYVAGKIAATLASTGTPAFYLHPTEALHGDLGKVSSGDVLLAFAYGGETQEVIEVAKFAKRLGCNIIAVTGRVDSSLAKLATILLDGSVDREVCPLNLAPTASTAVAMAIGDALSVCLMAARGFSEVDFAALHPGGLLGRKLSTVSDHMVPIEVGLPSVGLDADIHGILAAITKKNFGIVPVIGGGNELLGAISDGDIRRALQLDGAQALGRKANSIMKTNPKVVNPEALSLEAIRIMEQNQITSLFVVSNTDQKKLVGLLRMHDLLAAKIV
jgi:arabinose-5-phosphate isomerase